MRRTTMAAVAAVLALAGGTTVGCSVAGQDPPTGDPEQTISNDPTDDSQDGSQDGAAEVEDPDAVVARLQAIAPHLGEADLPDLVETCADIAGGVGEPELVEATVERFSGSGDEQVDDEQARAILDVARTEVCP